MSINDFMEMDITTPLFIGVVIGGILALILFPKFKKEVQKGRNEIYGSEVSGYNSTVKQALLLKKRTAPDPYNRSLNINYALFQFEDGGRVELAIEDNDIFSTMIEGDTGLLRYKEKRFFSFKRSELASDIQKPEESVVTKTAIDSKKYLPCLLKSKSTEQVKPFARVAVHLKMTTGFAVIIVPLRL